MVAFSSFFQQVLSLFPRAEFDRTVAEFGSDRHARGFSSRDQFVAMLYCQLAKANSLREIEDGLRSIEGKAVHLGIDPPARSTLSYANAHRPWQLYESLFHQTLQKVTGELAPKHKFKFKNKLVSLDSTMIDLCAETFEWARYKQTKGAVKLHMILDNAGHLPVFCAIDEGRASDLSFARTLELPAGTIVVFDRGYVDYAWFNSLSARDIWFVTRLRRCDVVQVVGSRAVSDGPVLRDEDVVVGKGELVEQVRLRRVTVLDDNGEEFHVFTNNWKLAASTIARIYRERWEIENFFKAIKQNLRIKTFVGTSANALKIQVWAALIAILLLKYFQMKSRLGWSLSRLVALLRQHLFTYGDLWAWLDHPFGREEPPLPPSLQADLQFG